LPSFTEDISEPVMIIIMIMMIMINSTIQLHKMP
jgi:hypothetical protein